MKNRFVFLISVVVAVGCSAQSTDTTVTPPVVTGAEDSMSAGSANPSVDESKPAASDTKVAGDSAGYALTPENTRIQFVATHVGPTPDPKARVGIFGDFRGQAVVEDDELKSISVEIQIASVDTQMEKLNTHLRSPDFFDAREYPTAKYETTRISRNEDGDHILTANLTLHGVTKEVSFPANVGMANGQLDLSANLKLDRTEFGMTEMTDKVNKEVELTIGVGKFAKSEE